MSGERSTNSAGALRRIGAIVYDALIVTGLLVVATLPLVPFLDGKVLVPSEVGALAHLYRVWQLVVVVGFFTFFWIRRGQTLGMLAWRLRIERLDGANLGWRDCLKRLGWVGLLLAPSFLGHQLAWGQWPDPNARVLAACLALAPVIAAYAWIWFDRDGRAWHDRWSGTRVIVLPKRARS
ncbi:MAG TPA: RDD family protein [Steroidobacter sp.]|nr:RDD family protein [Steroidobacter sp.]